MCCHGLNMVRLCVSTLSSSPFPMWYSVTSPFYFVLLILRTWQITYITYYHHHDHYDNRGYRLTQKASKEHQFVEKKTLKMNRLLLHQAPKPENYWCSYDFQKARSNANKCTRIRHGAWETSEYILEEENINESYIPRVLQNVTALVSFTVLYWTYCVKLAPTFFWKCIISFREDSERPGTNVSKVYQGFGRQYRRIVVYWRM